MIQITIYLAPRLAEMAKEAAESASLSQSQWIAQLIEEEFSTSWPDSVQQLAGTWSETFSEAEDLRETQGEDLPRDIF